MFCIRQEIDDNSQPIAYATNEQLKVNVKNLIKNSIFRFWYRNLCYTLWNMYRNMVANF